MTGLKPPTSRQVIKTLETMGFEIARQRGSHVFMRHPDGRRTVVPAHKGEAIGRGLLRHIIQAAGINKEEFFKASK